MKRRQCRGAAAARIRSENIEAGVEFLQFVTACFEVAEGWIRKVRRIERRDNNGKEKFDEYPDMSCVRASGATK